MVYTQRAFEGATLIISWGIFTRRARNMARAATERAGGAMASECARRRGRILSPRGQPELIYMLAYLTGEMRGCHR